MAMSLQTMIFRMMCRHSDNARDKGLTVLNGVECFCDIRYGRDKNAAAANKEQPDLFRSFLK